MSLLKTPEDVKKSLEERQEKLEGFKLTTQPIPRIIGISELLEVVESSQGNI